MKTKIIFMWSLVLLLFSCSSDTTVIIPDIPNDDCVLGFGPVVSESRNQIAFHSIDNTIYADVFITQGTQEDIVIDAQQNILDLIRTNVIDNELEITVEQCVEISQSVKIYITIPAIRTLTLTGVGSMVGQNAFDVMDLNIVLTGVGEFRLSGMTTNLDIDLVGVGDVEAFGLESEDCDVTISGVGDAEVWASNTLDVTISGTGSVFYKGMPTINSVITGTGEVVDAN